MIVSPRLLDNGWISATYPEFEVQSGDRFVAGIGCVANATKCDVRFQLNYQIGNGLIQSLDQWNEEYDEEMTIVDVDLSSLAGRLVKFILRVDTNDKYEDDVAFWFVPHIQR